MAAAAAWAQRALPRGQALGGGSVAAPAGRALPGRGVGAVTFGLVCDSGLWGPVGAEGRGEAGGVAGRDLSVALLAFPRKRTITFTLGRSG